MSSALFGDALPARSQFEWHDVRFIGAAGGRYVLPQRREGTEKLSAYACRLCSISTRFAAVIGPVVGSLNEPVAAHFDTFGLLRGRINRRLPSGFVMELMLKDAERDKLGAKIVWQRKHVYQSAPDQREHKRILPRDPRTLITLADGTCVPCFVIDISQSGVAVSAGISPEIGTPLAVGRLVGRVVRYLDVGFALQFIELQEADALETLMLPALSPEAVLELQTKF
ncbi:PilZ domain-containing protein [Devosia albogilva]|uniref:PilZ domain-containing protein n=1 Tax=Devosia albogilva TaxID=429726 RepID=A0ABW5QQY4_9HYPH